MKTKLIKLQDKFILVNDEEIKEGDYAYHKTFGIGKIINEFTEECFQTIKQKLKDGSITTPWKRNIPDIKKIIAGIPELPSIDFSLLSDADCLKIGWVDVEKLLKEAYKKHSVHEDKLSLDEQIQRSGGFNVGFKEGFQSAQSLNDKMFSLEDMRKAMFEVYKNGVRNPRDGKESFSELSNRVIQSLQQTNWDVEVEMEQDYTNRSCDTCCLQKVGCVMEDNSGRICTTKTQNSNHKEYWSSKTEDQSDYEIFTPKIKNNSIKVLKIK